MGRTLSATQATGKTMGLVKTFLDSFGFSFSSDIRKRSEKWAEVECIILRGGWTEILRFLGTFRPQRLLANAEKIWVGAATNYLPREKVIEIVHLGKRKVVALTTSTNTYIANGLLCHNSQFSFGIINGELSCRSHKKDILLDAPEQMFEKAIETIRELGKYLQPGWIYRCEYLQKPKHNVLAYGRVPNKNLILYDIMTGPEIYLSYAQKNSEASRLELECVPLLYAGKVIDFDMFKGMLDTTSILGGSLIEGVVVKNYNLMTQEKKVAMGKYVSEKFKEVAKSDWKDRNPTGKDMIELITEKYCTPARWQKAIIHMQEEGTYSGTPADIGALIKAIPEDILKECEDEIKNALFTHFWQFIRRGVTRGFPEWFKEQLAKSAFPEEGANG